MGRQLWPRGLAARLFACAAAVVYLHSSRFFAAHEEFAEDRSAARLTGAYLLCWSLWGYQGFGCAAAAVWGDWQAEGTDDIGTLRFGL